MTMKKNKVGSSFYSEWHCIYCGT